MVWYGKEMVWYGMVCVLARGVLTRTLACYAPAMWPCAIPSTARRAELQRSRAADMCDVLLASRVGSSPKHISISFTAACSLAEEGGGGGG